MAVTAERYLPIHVTQVDETRWDDCRVCAALMLVQAWTFGSVVQKPNGEFMSPGEIKKFREAMRDRLAADRQIGGLGPADTLKMIAKTWAWLPVPKQVVLSFSVLWERLGDGYAYSVSGNPSEVKNQLSKLRKWTNNDDFGHEILALRKNAKNDAVLIFDPLAPRYVNGKQYKGHWVPKQEFRQFLYLRDGNVLYNTQVKIGAMSQANRVRIAKNAQMTKIETAYDAKIERLQEERNALALKLAECESRPQTDCSEEVAAGYTDGVKQGWLNAIEEIDNQLREMENDIAT